MQAETYPEIADLRTKKNVSNGNKINPLTDNYCIHQLIKEIADRNPNAIAVVDDNANRLSYVELNGQADRVARSLQTSGVKSGDLVSICVDRSVNMAVGILGILKTGAAYVPLDPNYPQDRLEYMDEDAGASVLLTEGNYAQRFEHSIDNIVRLDSVANIDKLESPSVVSIDSANAAYVIYTSGTTGNPKGVVVTHRNLTSYVNSLPEALGLRPTDKYLHSASISFSSSVRQLMVPLSLGASVVIASTEHLRDPHSLFEFIAQEGVTVLDFVPSFWRSCVHALSEKMSDNNVQLLLSASEPFPTSVCKELKTIFNDDVRIINMYGQTETTGIISFFPINSAMINDSGIMPIGSPISHATMHILDENLSPMSDDAAGELYIGGAGVALGYLNRPELTEERFIKDPFSEADDARLYRTGDLAHYLPSGAIEYLGRIDDQVKLRGFRIELGEIESVINKFTDVREAVVTAYEQEGDKRLAAYIVSASGSKFGADEVRRFLKQKLPEYMIPSAFIQLEKIPLTPNGKLDRKSLPAPQQNVSTQREGYVAPTTETEKTVARIWSEMLGVNDIGINDNFFDLGGHSLLATQALVKVANETGVLLRVADLFNTPTISDIARKLGGANQTAKTSTIPLVLRAGKMPLSFAQQRLWFLDKLEPNSAAYNIPFGMRIDGEVNIEALRRALDKLIVRHESLRTTVKTINGEASLEIIDELRCNLSVIDISDLSGAERDAQVRALSAEEASGPFDLAASPLFRTKLLKLKVDEYVMLVTMHHVISDGWSLAVFFEELSEVYGGITQGIDVHLPELKLQYADFASWQRGTLAEAEIAKQLEFWGEKLADAEPLLGFPTDRQRPLVQTYKGANYRRTFSPELLEELRVFSRNEGVSLFMTLLAAFYTLIYRHANQDDLVLGVPIANRNYSDIERVIGFFANTLALRADLSGAPTFRTFLAQVKGLALESYDNQDVPFEKLVEYLNPKRSLSHNPIFQVMFGLHNTPPLKPELSGLNLTPIEMNTGTSRFDLEVLVRENPDGLGVLAEYSTDLFDESTIERFIERFEVLLRGILRNPEEVISILPILTETEQKLIVDEFNDTAKDYPTDKCVHQLFEEQVKSSPDAIAVVYQDQQLTYRELNQKANAIAHRLRRFNIGPDSLVGLCVERSVEMVAGVYGILKTGAAYVPLDPSYPIDRLNLMLGDSGASIIVSHQNLAKDLDSKRFEIIYMDDPSIVSDGDAFENPQSGVGMGNLAYINYTSGSTGVPKGVAIQHSSLNNYTQHLLEVLGTDRPLQFANVSTIAADLGNSCIYPALASGGTVHVISYDVLTNPDLFREYAIKNSIDVLKIVPSHLSALLGETNDGLELPKRCLIVGGEALSWDLVKRILDNERKCVVINEYGPTESTVGSAVAYIDKIESEYLASASIGKPAANTTTYILNESLQVVPIGVHGEIYIGGSGLARGYLNRPDLTEERFISDPFSKGKGARLYRTGDLARYLPNGEMEYLGRIDDQVKIRGFRIELGEIESVISHFTDVREAVVTTREEQKGDKRLIAYVVSRTNSKIEPAELRNFLREKLPDYMVPSAFIQLEKLPLTPNGKVDRKKLPAPEKETSSGRDGYVEARTETETKLAKIWGELLGVDKIGVQDNFFDLGGHSLLAIRMFSAVEETFQKSVPLATLFEAGTIEKLAEILSKEDWEEPEASLVPIQPGGNKIPFYCIHAIGGNVMFYSDLAKYLDKDQPLYGLQARRLAGRQVGHGTIEEMAAFYIKEILEHQPDGPYCLGGSSFGGLVAYEMARQLSRQGKDVGLLALFDTGTPEYKKARIQDNSKINIKVHEFIERIHLHKANIGALSGTEKIGYVVKKARQRFFQIQTELSKHTKEDRSRSDHKIQRQRRHPEKLYSVRGPIDARTAEIYAAAILRKNNLVQSKHSTIRFGSRSSFRVGCIRFVSRGVRSHRPSYIDSCRALCSRTCREAKYLFRTCEPTERRVMCF
ncbi:MAG: amino acid adenylation domain-containing protein [Chloracidobacterium sp.]|nr:amino acid adenylation domain-containing protein [Chloracidobacterium sp.]